jgi:hypothetical protein
MEELVFVGTNHLDIYGCRRLGRLLGSYKPKRVTVEAPSRMEIYKLEEFALDCREKQKEEISGWDFHENNEVVEWLKDLALKLSDSHLHEVTTLAEYCRNNEDIEVYAVDSTEIICETDRIGLEILFVMSKINERIGSDPLEKILKQETDRCIRLHTETCYMRPTTWLSEIDKNSAALEHLPEEVQEELIKGFDQAIQSQDKTYNEKREAHMAQKILEIRPEMHIGGLLHAYSEIPHDVERLIQRLEKAGLDIELVTLYDA